MTIAELFDNMEQRLIELGEHLAAVQEIFNTLRKEDAE